VLLIWISTNFRSLTRLRYYQLADVTSAYPFFFNRINYYLLSRAICSIRLSSFRWNNKRKDNFWFLGLLLKWSKIRVLSEYKLLEWSIITELSDSLIPLALPFFKFLLINLCILILF